MSALLHGSIALVGPETNSWASKASLAFFKKQRMIEDSRLKAILDAVDEIIKLTE